MCFICSDARFIRSTKQPLQTVNYCQSVKICATVSANNKYDLKKICALGIVCDKNLSAVCSKFNTQININVYMKRNKNNSKIDISACVYSLLRFMSTLTKRESDHDYYFGDFEY